MLIAAITALVLFFGHASDLRTIKGTVAAMRTASASCVADEARLARVQAALDGMDRAADDFNRQVRELRAALMRTDRDYTATARDYRETTRQIDEVWDRVEQRLIDLRFEMRAAMTRAEWNAFYDLLREAKGDRP